MTLRYYQRNALDELDNGWSRGLRCQLLRMGTGTGKCFRKGTLVLMGDGTTKPVEDIVVGDLLASPTSGVRRVLSLARGRETMYRVTPVKGYPYVVNASHLLSLRNESTGALTAISVRDYLDTLTSWRMNNPGWRVPGVLSGDMTPELTHIKVNSVGRDDYYGFALDGDHLFLLADFTVVHNSKTAAHALLDNSGGGLAMAHRREIVAQLSLALAREGVRHRVLGPPDLGRLCMQTQIEDLGTHFVAPGARVGVASTDSLAVIKGEEDFLRQVTLAVPDEFHHYLRENAYGKAINRLRPECRLLGPTATPARTDGKGLGEHADGFAQEIVHGPTEAKMMAEGFLCPYQIFVPPTSFNREALGLGASHEFKKEDVRRETQRSHIFGDAVKHYVSRVPGKTALAFVDSIESATDLCRDFRAAGVRAEALSGKTEVGLRTRTLRKFAHGEVDVIISVQLIDEGFDCPGVQVVLDLAATTSLIRYRQRFGRGWRPDARKDFFRYFDFVGNVGQHGLPEAYRKWTLDRRSARGKGEPSDHIPVRTCENAPLCDLAYERVLPRCPYCGHEPVPAIRSGPDKVDGDLILLDEATRAAMLGQIAQIDGAASIPYGASYAIAGRLRNVQHAKQVAQQGLRYATALYGGWQASLGRSDREGQRRFYHRYGIDLWSAWGLDDPVAAANLEEKIRLDLAANGIIDGTVN